AETVLPLRAVHLDYASFPLCEPRRFLADSARGGASPATCAPATLRPLRLRVEVGRDIVSEVDRPPRRTLRRLRRVGSGELAEVQRYVFGQPIFTPAAAGGHRSDQDLLELQLQILQRILAARLAHHQRRFVEMLAGRAC